MNLPLCVSRPRRRAFTLIELLVVIGIIAVLIGILLPTFGKAKEMSRTTQCAANMRSLLSAANAYTTSNDGTVLPYRADLNGNWQSPSQIYYWPNILVDGRYVEAPTLPPGSTSAGPLGEGPFFCPSGNMELLPPNLNNNTTVPASRTDTMGAVGNRNVSIRTNRIVDCWYAMNATVVTLNSIGQGNGDPGLVQHSGPPGREVGMKMPSFKDNSPYLQMSSIKDTSHVVFLFDGLIYHHMNANANRLNARHGDRTQTNIGFLDGHVETWMTKNLPGGIGVATTADVSLANIRANYSKAGLIWYLEQ